MLVFYGHPFSSYTWKALIAFYERDVAFAPYLVDLGDPHARAAFEAIWPLRRFPVLVEGFHIRRGSGGAGRWRGGDGVIRLSRRKILAARKRPLTGEGMEAPAFAQYGPRRGD